jgi:LAO/AO transport system kinase
MLGLRNGATLKNVPAHHGIDLGRVMTRDEQLAMNPGRAARAAAKDGNLDQWIPPVLRAVATKREGLDEFSAALDRHFSYLEISGTLGLRRRARLRERVVDVVGERVQDRLWNDAGTNRWLDDQLAALESGTSNPFDVADALLARSGDLLTRNSQ